MSQQNHLIQLNTSEAISEFNKFTVDLNKLSTESIEINRLIALTNNNIQMIQQRTRVLKKKGDCLRPYALNNYGLNYPIIELDKIKLEADFIQDDSYYSYLPNASPPLKLIGTDPNLPHQSQPSNQPSTTSQPLSSTNQSSNHHSHASPLNNTNRNSHFTSQNTPVNRAQKRINSPDDDDDELLCSQEKVFSKNLKKK